MVVTLRTQMVTKTSFIQVLTSQAFTILVKEMSAPWWTIAWYLRWQVAVYMYAIVLF